MHSIITTFLDDTYHTNNPFIRISKNTYKKAYLIYHPFCNKIPYFCHLRTISLLPDKSNSIVDDFLLLKEININQTFLAHSQQQIYQQQFRKEVQSAMQFTTNNPNNPDQIDYKQLIFQEYNAIYERKREQYQKEVSVVIKELASSPDRQKNEPVISYLNMPLSTTPMMHFSAIYRQMSARITEIIKQSVSSTQAQLYELQGEFYRQTAALHLTLTKLSNNKDKQWLSLFHEPKSLISINLLPYFFHYNNEYKEKSSIQIPLWNNEELSTLLSIPPYSVKKCAQCYLKHVSLVDQDLTTRFGILVAVITLLKFKARVCNARKRSKQDYKEIYQERSRKDMKRDEETVASSKSSTFAICKYSFCEIAIFSREKQVNVFPAVQKKQILRQVAQMAEMSCHAAKRKQILVHKMKFQASFNRISQMMSNVEENDAQNNEPYFQEDTHSDLKHLQKKIQYAFACELSTTKAIEQLDLQKLYNTKLNYHFNVGNCRSDVIACFTKATLTTFKKYYEFTALQLELQELIQPVMVIKKFYFSFNSLMGIKDGPGEMDLVSTLIIATQANKVIFHHVCRQKLMNECYLSKLKDIIAKRNKKLPQTVVLSEHQIGNPLKWFQIADFIKFIYKHYHSRLYVFNKNSVSRLAIKLYVYILECLKKFTPLITKQGFFIFVEGYAQKVVKIYDEVHK